MEQKTFFTILKKTIREEVRNVIKQELSEILKEGLQSTVNELKEERLPKKKPIKKSATKFASLLFIFCKESTSHMPSTLELLSIPRVLGFSIFLFCGICVTFFLFLVTAFIA